MEITQAAAQTITNTMRLKGLDPLQTYLCFEVINGSFNMSFSRDRTGIVKQFYGLQVTIDPRLELDDMRVDFGEANGKRGLIFTGGQHGN